MPNEQQIEDHLIGLLTHTQNQWTYRPDIKTEAQLWDNVRKHVNRVNIATLDGKPLSDKEFDALKAEFRRLTVTPFQACQWLRGENGVAQLQIDRDDPTQGRVSLTMFSNKDIAGGISSYEVVNQITPDAGVEMRGDVTLLINGLPIIQIELKTEYAKDGYLQAFDQFKRYAEGGFFNGIFATTQIFVVSNKVSTKYFARPMANTEGAFNKAREFLFNWRTPDNKPEEDLYDFARDVLSIPAAHHLVSDYTVLVDDQKTQKYLMVLRPYQIHAIKKISEQASKHEGGFIWHATGSGKTITSFVATKLLAKAATGVARTVMIVDRVDLDNQTKDEFTKFASEFHTGQSSGKGVSNTLVVGVGNRSQLTRALLSDKHSSSIIVTTIQKLSAAVRDADVEDHSKFEKLRAEHIVFIVDECHRAVSDEEMKNIRKQFPNSTWFGFTGTPIFEENQKAEKGTFARTTHQQYGPQLHAYTTKNAMDDGSVLGFQAECFDMLTEDSEEKYLYQKVKEKWPNADPKSRLESLSPEQKEALIESDIYEREEYIELMLKKIFRRQSVMEKFAVRNGMPTMSAILTTSSIAQAKRIYRKLKEMQRDGTLLNGDFLDERLTLADPDFPRVAISYSFSDEQGEILKEQEELAAIIADYNAMFDDVANAETYVQKVNARLARKEALYQKDGQWLDLVIVVDRLLTGFDAPTMQTLYVDRDLRYQKLLQAFSRTNRLYPGKKAGMVVSFRKPNTMRQNIEDAIRLFSDEDQGWADLVPREYDEVKTAFNAARDELNRAKSELELDPQNLTKKVEQVRAFQQLEKQYGTLKSYDQFQEEASEFTDFEDVMRTERGICENLKGEIKAEMADIDNPISVLQEIEFTSGNKATVTEQIDSYYIARLFGQYQAAFKEEAQDQAAKERQEELRNQILDVVDDKPEIVKRIYLEILKDISSGQMDGDWKDYFRRAIHERLEAVANRLQVPVGSLRTSLNEYRGASEPIPYFNQILSLAELAKNKEAFEKEFNQMFRKSTKVIENYRRTLIEDELLPLKGEL